MSDEREVLTRNDAFLLLTHARDHALREMQQAGRSDFDTLHILMGAMSSVAVGAEGMIY